MYAWRCSTCVLTVQRRTVYDLTVRGAYSGTFVISIGCFEADRVTLFRNPHCARDVARFDVRRVVVIQPVRSCPVFSDPACTTERHMMKRERETNFTTRWSRYVDS